MNKSSMSAVALASPLVLLMGFIIAIPIFFGGEDCSTTDLSPRAATSPLGAKSVGRWNDEQVKNAAIIAAVGKKLNVPKRGRVIAIMTAMGESSLTVIDRGDAVGPDSRGLFQQRANGAWGSYADRMSPVKSSENFYRALLRVEGWDGLTPTEAAHRVQRNADPDHYTPFWPEAIKVYAVATGEDVDLASSDIAPECIGDDITPSAYGSGVTCDFGGGKANQVCRDALVRAAEIHDKSACTSDLGGGNWYRWCLAFVARAYGLRFAGYSTAMDMYRAMKAQGKVSTSKKIPPGALVWFRASSPAGHVALYAGDGKAWSNDYVRKGCIDLTPMTTLGASGYLGWSPPNFNV